MFEVRTKQGHAIWNISEDGTVTRWCELYDEEGAHISFENEEESKQHIHSVLIPFLKTVLSELQNIPENAMFLKNLPAVLHYAKQFI